MGEIGIELGKIFPEAKSYAAQLNNIDNKSGTVMSFNGSALSAVLIASPLMISNIKEFDAYLKLGIILFLCITIIVTVLSVMFTTRCVWLIRATDFDCRSGDSEAKQMAALVLLKRESNTRYLYYKLAVASSFVNSVLILILVLLFIIATAITSGTIS